MLISWGRKIINSTAAQAVATTLLVWPAGVLAIPVRVTQAGAEPAQASAIAVVTQTGTEPAQALFEVFLTQAGVEPAQSRLTARVTQIGVEVAFIPAPCIGETGPARADGLPYSPPDLPPCVGPGEASGERTDGVAYNPPNLAPCAGPGVKSGERTGV